ncbi:hypothetical protein Tco_1546165 [Tanacetum coccineum]
MISPSSSRYNSNDMVHNHYIEEAKKKTQESSRNSRPSVMPFAKSQSTSNSSKPKPRINNQKSRNWPASKSSWTGRIFNTVGLRWVPTRKIFTSSTTTVDSEPPNVSNTDITNLYECIQNLDSSAGTSINVQEEQTLDLNARTLFNLKKERIKAWKIENVISRRPRLIQNGNSKREFQLERRLNSNTFHRVTAQKFQAVEKGKKEKNILLMAITPNEHMRRFSWNGMSAKEI